jgi:hypothetical protein
MRAFTPIPALRTAVILLVLASVVRAQDVPSPFRVGEEMQFEIRALGIAAAWQKLRVDGMTNVNGRPAYKIVSELKTYPAVEVFYKMHDQSISCLDATDFNVLSVHSRQRQGNWRNEAFITNSTSQQKIYYLRNGKKWTLLNYRKPVVDLIGMIYHGRTLPQAVGTMYEFSIINIEKIKRIRARAVLREKKRVGALDAKVTLLKIQQVDAEDEDKYEDVAFWITADDRRIPVRVRSMKIRLGPLDLGNVESVLVQYSAPKAGQP